MSELCSNCGEVVPPSVRNCIACAVDVGYPNVRAAARADESNRLAERLTNAKVSANARGITAELDSFENTVRINSKAVTNKNIGALHSWLSDQNPLMATYHLQVRANSRHPENNEWDQQRISADNSVNPNYYEQISFGALTLDNGGLTYYGDYSICLRENLIAHRATVFEENPFLFNKKHAVIAGQPVPPGYRAVWERRQELAAAKLGAKINKGDDEAKFANILIEQKRNLPDCDFIEVHIYGLLHRATIEHVKGPVPTKREDRVLWTRVKRELSKIGATWDEI